MVLFESSIFAGGVIVTYSTFLLTSCPVYMPCQLSPLSSFKSSVEFKSAIIENSDSVQVYIQ